MPYELEFLVWIASRTALPVVLLGTARLNALPPDEKRQALAALAEARRSVVRLPFFNAQIVPGIVNAETMIPRGMRSVVLTREEAEELDCEDLAQPSKR